MQWWPRRARELPQVAVAQLVVPQAAGAMQAVPATVEMVTAVPATAETVAIRETVTAETAMERVTVKVKRAELQLPQPRPPRRYPSRLYRDPSFPPPPVKSSMPPCLIKWRRSSKNTWIDAR